MNFLPKLEPNTCIHFLRNFNSSGNGSVDNNNNNRLDIGI